MVAGRLDGLIGTVRRLAAVANHTARSDAQLLGAFRIHADEAAFEALVRRHGPMVLGTCRRILVRAQDAEDAFQATFLVLVRKAHTISRPELLGPWLHVVAGRIARKTRTLVARRHSREQQLMEADHPVTLDREPNHELTALLDDALHRLPERYRAALVLCELQGRSRQQAARALGVPEGTLSSRLARGRQLLAGLLQRRGMVLSAGAVTAVCADSRADAVPPALVRATVRAALAAAVANAALAPMALISDGVLNAMIRKPVLMLTLVLGLLLLGTTLVPRPEAAEPAGVKPVAGAAPAGKEKTPARKPSVIILWMGGGPSQMDTFDLKPGQANGGPFREIKTTVKEIRISEHLPKLAKHMKDMVLIRGMSHREGDHARGTHLMLTGYPVQKGVQYATLAEVLAKELGGDKSVVPNYVRMPSPPILFRPAIGSLGKRYRPLHVVDAPDGVQIPEEGLFMDMADKEAEAWHKTMTEAVDLTTEKDAVRQAYGDDRFGTHCLLARRLVERNVPVVEIALGGWDTHGDNFAIVEKQSAVLDAGWSALMADLKERKLLDSTLIVWMGEFGRTPRINAQKGRDHWPSSFTVVLAGGGIKGGQVIGKTAPDGVGITERAVSVPELHATIYRTVGVNRTRRYPSSVEGVTIPIVDGPTEPIGEIVPPVPTK
jgi:RNA polymerase sigma factor (sigma-70 family)